MRNNEFSTKWHTCLASFQRDPTGVEARRFHSCLSSWKTQSEFPYRELGIRDHHNTGWVHIACVSGGTPAVTPLPASGLTTSSRSLRVQKHLVIARWVSLLATWMINTSHWIEQEKPADVQNRRAPNRIFFESFIESFEKWKFPYRIFFESFSNLLRNEKFHIESFSNLLRNEKFHIEYFSNLFRLFF